ncbi:diacylglycerol kinase [Stylonychia lemnae]|uniref:Diacylglycerol kinase n=1 Tax=Stylonychia lemnae TaxID=5949 RepID=A0A078AVF5_STYLE|nr:diacylglycerol kinase [Stylonychia lemnae]|eukprot:CDW86031.1 diacylglycerol kinase [Stylonychia lemnae]
MSAGGNPSNQAKPFDFSKFNFDVFQFHKSYQRGFLKALPQIDHKTLFGIPIYKGFKHMPSFTPFRLKDQNFQINYDSISNLQDKQAQQVEVKRQFQDKLELIQPEQFRFSKGVAIIYNPNSGKNRDIRKIITSYFEIRNIRYQLFETKRISHGIEYAKTIDISQYDALMAVGGDGTLHEVVNGMLKREDKLKVPLIMMPNGTGNDFCASIDVFDYKDVLMDLQNPSKFKIDVLKVSIDKENTEEIPSTGEDKHIRYSIINSCISLLASSSVEAKKYKKFLGSSAYILTSVKGLLTHKSQYYDVEIDDQKVLTNFNTIILNVCNGKYAGGMNAINGYGFINDGLTEINICRNVLEQKNLSSLNEIRKLIDEITKKGGTHVYNPNFYNYRGKKIKVINKSSRDGIKEQRHLVLDGEEFQFQDFVIYDVLPEEIEIIIDYERLLKKSQYFI